MQPSRQPSDGSTAASTGPIRILVVDENADRAAAMLQCLEKHGHEGTRASSIADALSSVAEAFPEIVIIDTDGVSLDGYELCRALKSKCSAGILLMLPLADPAELTRLLKCGADGFIRKPVDETALLRRIAALRTAMGSRDDGVDLVDPGRQQLLELLIASFDDAVALRNELENREGDLQRAHNVLRGLYRIAEGLNQATTEQEVTDFALERALELPGIRAGWIFLRKPDGSFRVAASRNLPTALTASAAMAGLCSCLRRLLDGSLDAASNIFECERLQRATGDTSGLRFHASIPLHLADDTVGVLNLVGPNEGLFNEEELRTLYNVGTRLAVALDRARLREALERLVEERTARIAEQAALLEENEQRYRLLFDRNPHPTWVYDAETLAFLAVNLAAIRHYGYSREEFLSMTIRDLRSAEDQEQLDRALVEYADTEEPQTIGIFRHRKKDGTQIEVEISSSEIHFANRVATLVLAVDVTEKLQLERQFLRAQRMESIGTLAGGIAHDLNNLLMPIMMGVTLLKRTHPTEQAERALENIERSAQRGKDLVRQVLSFARGVEGIRVAVQIRDIVNEIHTMLESTFPKNIEVVPQIDADLWQVEGDPTQINQVLLNLCVNARDAMPSGGRMTIAARNVEVDERYVNMHRATRPGRYVCVEITDEGVGIAKELIDRIFEPFFTTKDVGRGTGLGLSTVSTIVRSHGGFVNVYSEPGRGSRFRAYFPVRAEGHVAPVEHPEVHADLPRGNGETILIVDDEASILAITRETLEAFGYTTLVADDGAAAIGLFAMHRPRIAAVITDMMMPVMDGPALVAALHRIDPSVRIIGSSGISANRAPGATKGHIRWFLQKPYSADVLLQTLHRVLTSDDPS